MDISRRLVLTTSIERVHISQHAAETPVVNILGDEPLCRQQYIVRIGEEVMLLFGRTEVK